MAVSSCLARGIIRFLRLLAVDFETFYHMWIFLKYWEIEGAVYLVETLGHLTLTSCFVQIGLVDLSVFEMEDVPEMGTKYW